MPHRGPIWAIFLPARSLAAVVGLSWGGGDTAAPHHRAIIATIVEVQEKMEQFKFTFNIGVPQRLHHQLKLSYFTGIEPINP